MEKARMTKTAPWRPDAVLPDAVAQVVLIISGFEPRTLLRIQSLGLSAPCFGFRVSDFGFSTPEVAHA
jgi:hypothetical protein